MLKKLLTSSFVKSIVVIASGTAAAQLVGMIFVPFITRIYGPEVYGVLGAFLALVTVLSPFVALAYPMAIVLPKEDDQASALVVIALLLSSLLSGLIFIALWVAGEWLLSKVGATSLIAYMFLIPLVVLVTAWQDIATQWLVRKKIFKRIAQVALAQSLLKNTSQLMMGLYAPLAFLLIILHALGVVFSVVLLALSGRTGFSFKIKKAQYLKQIAYEHRDFPMYRAPQVVLNAFSQSLPVLMLTAFFGVAAAGFYTLTRAVLGLPLNVLGNAVQNVFYPHFNEAVTESQGKKDKKALWLMLKSIGGLAAVGIWPFLILILFGPELFSFVFGSDWAQAGSYAQWLSVWMFFNLINRPSIAAIPVLKLQRWFLGFEVWSVLLRMGVIYIGFFYFEDALITVALFSLIGALLSAAIMLKTIASLLVTNQ